MEGYTSYQHLQLGWTDILPSHWGVKRLKRVLSERKENNNPVKTNEILSLTNTRGVIPYSEKGNIGNKSKENIEGYHLTYPNDLVVNSMNVVIGSVGVSDYFGAISPVYYALMSRGEANIKYYEYIFRLPSFEETLKGLGNGILEIRMRIPMSKLNNVLLPLPPRVEQDQIVRFLDWKVSEINKLIRIKREQIKGYTEYEKKVINDKILHGLRNETLKESGDQWLGKIPISWKVIKLGRFCSFQNGISESGDFFTSGTPFVGYGDVYRHLELPETVNGVAKANKQQQEMFSVHKGDIFFTRTSENIEEIGMAAVCNHTIEKAVFSGFLIRCRPRLQIINMDFMKYYLQIPAVRNHFSSMMNIVIRASLGQNLLKQMPVVVPSLEEQKEIAIYLDSLHEKFTRLIDATQKEISTMMELKNRLISDVVTGKIDVRDIAVPEYEHVDDIADDDSDVDEESEENETEIDGEEA